MFYVTKGEFWKFILHRTDQYEKPYLAVKFSKSNAKPKETENEKEKKIYVYEDTTVTVWNVTWEIIKFENYLFLCASPPEETYITKHGSILFAENYRHKLCYCGFTEGEVTFSLDFEFTYQNTSCFIIVPVWLQSFRWLLQIVGFSKWRPNSNPGTP